MDIQQAQALSHTTVEIAASSLPHAVVTYLVEEKMWHLEQTYKHQDGATLITVPQGFRFDLASVPRIIWWLVSPFELSIVAPLVHDFLYLHKGDPPAGAIDPPRRYTRKASDQLFKRIMKKEGVGWWRWRIAYAAVRAFGGASWGTDSVTDTISPPHS